MDTPPMVRTQIFLDSEIKEQAKRVAEEDGYASMAEVIRQALVFFFASRLSASKQDASKQVVREAA